MSKSIIVTERVKTVTTEGVKEVTTKTTEIALKDLNEIHMGAPSTMGNKLAAPIATTVFVMNDDSRVIVFAAKSEVWQAVKRVATSGKNQTVPSTVPAIKTDAEVIEALLSEI